MTEKGSAIPSPDDVLDRLETDDEMDVETRLADRLRPESIALAGGAVVVVGAIRSLLRGRFRGLVQGVVGLALLRYGLRKRQSEETDGESSGKRVSDEAHEARERDEVDGQPRTDPVGEAEGDESGDVVFTDDSQGPRSKPSLDADVEDPRMNDDDPVEIDVSEASLADEASEAAGPSPEQAQPTRTDDTEPESTPDADASRGDEESTADEEESADEESTLGTDADESDDRDVF